jgi:hypothetical protein
MLTKRGEIKKCQEEVVEVLVEWDVGDLVEDLHVVQEEIVSVQTVDIGNHINWEYLVIQKNV